MVNRALRLLDDNSIEWEVAHDWSGPVWTGNRFVFGGGTHRETWQFHEFMHWVMASEEERKYPDFGLGMNTDSHDPWSSSTWRHEPVRRDNCGTTRSWSDEPRLSLYDSSRRESLSVWAIGLFSLVYPDAKGDTESTLVEFGAYEDNPFTWEPKHCLEIAIRAEPYLGFDPAVASLHLEHLRSAGCRT